jgi:hypothetical protein
MKRLRNIFLLAPDTRFCFLGNRNKFLGQLTPLVWISLRHTQELSQNAVSSIAWRGGMARQGGVSERQLPSLYLVIPLSAFSVEHYGLTGGIFQKNLLVTKENERPSSRIMSIRRLCSRVSLLNFKLTHSHRTRL